MVSLDERLFFLINGLAGKSEALDRFMALVVGEYFIPVAIVMVLLTMWFLGKDIQRRERNQRAVWYALVGVGFANAIVEVLNNFCERLRPFEAFPGDVTVLFYQPTDPSFPLAAGVRGPGLPGPFYTPAAADTQPLPVTATPGAAKKHIQPGVTTQAEVIEVFGTPNIITMKDGYEMWVYDKVSSKVAGRAFGIGGAGGGVGGAGAGGGVISGRAGSVERSETTVMLIVYFDENDIVSDYKISQTKF